MHGGHERFFDTKMAFKHSHYWRNTVRCTTSIANNIRRIFDFVFVYAKDNRISPLAFGGSRNNYFFRTTTVNMGPCKCWINKKTSTLNDDIDSILTPWQLSRILFGKHRDVLAINNNASIIMTHIVLICTVRRIMLQKMR
ncbi:hypothetical protein D3C72_1366080 [compost metagenome]